MTDLMWWEQGACRTAGLPLDTWLPDRRHPRGWNRAQQAKIDACRAVCQGCPVAGPCHTEAMGTEGEVAIRAGLTAEDRSAIRAGRPMPTRAPEWKPRQLGPITHGTNAGHSAHQRRHEDPCDECKVAHAAYQLARYHARKRARSAS